MFVKRITPPGIKKFITEISFPPQFQVIKQDDLVTALWYNATGVLAGPPSGSGTPAFRTLLPSDLPPHTHSWNDLTDKPTTSNLHTHDWDEITSKPSTFPPVTHTHSWADITDKPSTFPPDTHSHTWADITSKPTTVTGYGLSFGNSAGAICEGNDPRLSDSRNPNPHTHESKDTLILTKSISVDYTLTLSDAGKVIILTGSTNRTVTLPTNATVPFPIGTSIYFAQENTGVLTIGATSGVVIKSNGNKLKTNGQYAVASCVKTDTDTWYCGGNLVA